MPRHFGVMVCPSTDLFCEDVPDSLIEKILEVARGYSGKGFVFSTKNPGRYRSFIDQIPVWSYLTATVESDIDHGCSLAPPPMERLEEMRKLRGFLRRGLSSIEVCLSIQPVMEFTDGFVDAVLSVKPDQVSISYELTGIEGFPTPEFSRVLALAKTVSEEATVTLNCIRIQPDSHLDDWPLRELDGYDLERLFAKNLKSAYDVSKIAGR